VLFLQKVSQPRAAESDFMPVLIARRAKTVASRNLRPRLGGIREYAVESVKGMLRPGVGSNVPILTWPTSSRGLRDECPRNFLVVNRLLIGEKLCELTARYYSCHR
jgi:hypothetical protein